MLKIDGPCYTISWDLFIVERSVSRQTSPGCRRLGERFPNLQRKVQELRQMKKGVFMSQNAYRRMLFRAQAASGPKLVLAYHKIIRGIGSRLCNVRWTTKSISRANTAYIEIVFRRRHTETGPPLLST